MPVTRDTHNLTHKKSTASWQCFFVTICSVNLLRGAQLCRNGLELVHVSFLFLRNICLQIGIFIKFFVYVVRFVAGACHACKGAAEKKERGQSKCDRQVYKSASFYDDIHGVFLLWGLYLLLPEMHLLVFL